MKLIEIIEEKRETIGYPLTQKYGTDMREHMDLNLRMIHARDFLKTTPTGEFDLAKSKQLLLMLASENAAPRQYDILLDLRQTTGNLTFTDVAELVEEMIENRESFRSKLAILTSKGHQFDNAKFMELYAGNRGFLIGAFDDFEKTMNWMMASNDLTADA